MFELLYLKNFIIIKNLLLNLILTNIFFYSCKNQHNRFFILKTLFKKLSYKIILLIWANFLKIKKK